MLPTDEALRRAREAGLDLVEVAPTERPPVCRIMDYGKWKYQQKKKHKKHHEQQLKEVRMSPKTDDHDREIKMNRAKEFLADGDKVQFTMIFRGRERFHQDRGYSIFGEIVEQLSQVAKVERPARTEGRRMTMVLAPDKSGGTKPAVRKPETSSPTAKVTARLAAAASGANPAPPIPPATPPVRPAEPAPPAGGPA